MESGLSLAHYVSLALGLFPFNNSAEILDKPCKFPSTVSLRSRPTDLRSIASSEVDYPQILVAINHIIIRLHISPKNFVAMQNTDNVLKLTVPLLLQRNRRVETLNSVSQSFTIIDALYEHTKNRIRFTGVVDKTVKGWKSVLFVQTFLAELKEYADFSEKCRMMFGTFEMIAGGGFAHANQLRLVRRVIIHTESR